MDENLGNNIYHIITVKPLHTLHLRMLEWLKEFAVVYLCVVEWNVTLFKSGRKTRTANLYKTRHLHVCNNQMTIYERYFRVPGLRFFSSTTQKFIFLNGLFTLTALKVMLGGEDYSNIYVVILFVPAFQDRYLSDECHPHLTSIHTLNSDIDAIIMYNTADWGLTTKMLTLWNTKSVRWNYKKRLCSKVLKFSTCFFLNFICWTPYQIIFPDLQT